MRLIEFQAAAARVARTDIPLTIRRTIAGLGLTGEAGEVADLIKKEVGHGHPENRERIAVELGDVLWNLAETATCYGLSLDDIASINVQKMLARYPCGFTVAASLHRTDKD